MLNASSRASCSIGCNTGCALRSIAAAPAPCLLHPNDHPRPFSSPPPPPPVCCVQTIVRSVPGAKPGREGMEREIFGMNGVPDGAEPGKPFGDKSE